MCRPCSPAERERADSRKRASCKSNVHIPLMIVMACPFSGRLPHASGNVVVGWKWNFGPEEGQKARQTGQSESLSDREQGILRIKKMSAAQSNGVPVQYVRQMYPLFCPRSRWKQASNRPRIRTWHGKTVLGPLPCRFAPDLTFCLSVCGRMWPCGQRSRPHVPVHTSVWSGCRERLIGIRRKTGPRARIFFPSD